MGQEHPDLAVGYLAQPAAVLPGHPRRFPPLIGEVAAAQHPHCIRVLQPEPQIVLRASHHRIIVPRRFGKKALHRPDGDTHRLGEVFGVAPVPGHHQHGVKIVSAVVPRLPAAEQRR